MTRISINQSMSARFTWSFAMKQFDFLIGLALLAVPAVALAQDREPRGRADGMRTITVTGTAEEAMTPDLAELTVGIESRSRNASDCLAANGREMTALMDVLKNHAIAPKNIQTSRLDLSPVYDRPKSENAADKPAAKILGYQVNNRVIITIRDTKKVGELLDLMVKAGVNQIHDLSFTVSNKKSMLRDLRKRALADAREKAEDAANDAGMIRGNPVSIRLEDTNENAASFGMAGGRRDSDLQLPPSTPIAMGQEVLSVIVEVVYEMKPAK